MKREHQFQVWSFRFQIVDLNCISEFNTFSLKVNTVKQAWIKLNRAYLTCSVIVFV
jgi:hypothetical protein